MQIAILPSADGRLFLESTVDINYLLKILKAAGHKVIVLEGNGSLQNAVSRSRFNSVILAGEKFDWRLLPQLQEFIADGGMIMTSGSLLEFAALPGASLPEKRWNGSRWVHEVPACKIDLGRDEQAFRHLSSPHELKNKQIIPVLTLNPIDALFDEAPHEQWRQDNEALASMFAAVYLRQCEPSWNVRRQVKKSQYLSEGIFKDAFPSMDRRWWNTAATAPNLADAWRATKGGLECLSGGATGTAWAYLCFESDKPIDRFIMEMNVISLCTRVAECPERGTLVNIEVYGGGDVPGESVCPDWTGQNITSKGFKSFMVQLREPRTKVAAAIRVEFRQPCFERDHRAFIIKELRAVFRHNRVKLMHTAYGLPQVNEALLTRYGGKDTKGYKLNINLDNQKQQPLIIKVTLEKDRKVLAGPFTKRLSAETAEFKFPFPSLSGNAGLRIELESEYVCEERRRFLLPWEARMLVIRGVHKSTAYQDSMLFQRYPESAHPLRANSNKPLPEFSWEEKKVPLTSYPDRMLKVVNNPVAEIERAVAAISALCTNLDNSMAKFSLDDRAGQALAEAKGLAELAGEYLKAGRYIESADTYRLACRLRDMMKGKTEDRVLFPVRKGREDKTCYGRIKSIDWYGLAKKEIAKIEEKYGRPKGREIFNIFLIPRSHEDWWDYTCVYLFECLIKNVLRIMKEQPSLRWTFEQAGLLYLYWHLHPEDRATLTRYVRQGRMEICLPWVLFYGHFDSGETILQNLLMAKKWVESTFGVSPEVVCRSDTDGQPSMMPQLANLAGAKYLCTSNMYGVKPVELGTQFRWSSADGSEVLVDRMMQGYWGLSYYKLNNFYTARESLLHYILALKEHSPTQNIHVSLFGADTPYLDHATPHVGLEEFLDYWNRTEYPRTGYRLLVGTPRMYLSLVEKEPDLPVLKGGDFGNPHWGAGAVGYPLHKKLSRDADNSLLVAERAASLAAVSGISYPHSALKEARRILTMGFIHDCIAGIYPSYVRMARAQGLGEWVINGSLKRIAGKREAQGSLNDIVLFNPLSWSRDGLCRLPLQKGMVIPACGRNDAQLSQQIITAKGGKEILLYSGRMEALSLKSFGISMSGNSSQGINKVLSKYGSLFKTPFFEFKVDELNGGSISFLKDRRNNKMVWDSPAALFRCYKSFLSRDGYISAKGCLAESEIIENGTVRAGILVQGKVGPFLLRTVYYVYGDIPRIDVHAEIRSLAPNTGGVLIFEFPLPEGITHWDHSTPWGFIKRPIDEKPSQGVPLSNPLFTDYCVRYWADYPSASSGEGYAIFNRGSAMFGIDPDHPDRMLYKYFVGWDLAWTLDCRMPLDVEFSIYPHEGGWREGNVARAASEYNIEVVPVLKKHSRLTNGITQGLITFDLDSVEICAVRQNEGAENSLLVRIREMYGRKATVKLSFAPAIKAVYSADAAGTLRQKIYPSAEAVFLDFRPLEVRTFIMEI
ncbi:MAG: hypothetical protein L6455_02150 [Kiritimatiellae bacterium]|nr:hypothetical protein [Kiritimatiellia bacterium]